MELTNIQKLLTLCLKRRGLDNETAMSLCLFFHDKPNLASEFVQSIEEDNLTAEEIQNLFLLVIEHRSDLPMD